MRVCIYNAAGSGEHRCHSRSCHQSQEFTLGPRIDFRLTGEKRDSATTAPSIQLEDSPPVATSAAWDRRSHTVDIEHFSPVRRGFWVGDMTYEDVSLR